MTRRVLSIAPLVLLVLLVSLASTQIARADYDDDDWDKDGSRFKIFGAAVWVSPLGEDDVDFGSVRDSIQASDELGWNVGFEARFNRVIGLEIDYINATTDIEFGPTVVGEVRMQPLSATLNFHIVPTEVFDLYLGPTFTYFIWSDEQLLSGQPVVADNETAVGASLGVEIGLGETVAIMGGVRWLRVDFPSDVIEEFAVDPLFTRLGLAFRF